MVLLVLLCSRPINGGSNQSQNLYVEAHSLNKGSQYSIYLTNNSYSYERLQINVYVQNSTLVDVSVNDILISRIQVNFTKTVYYTFSNTTDIGKIDIRAGTQHIVYENIRILHQSIEKYELQKNKNSFLTISKTDLFLMVMKARAEIVYGSVIVFPVAFYLAYKKRSSEELGVVL